MSRGAAAIPQGSPTRRHYPELDGVRGLAFLSVFFFHCRTIAAPAGAWQSAVFEVQNAGWIGVDLFFVLSGFLITGILLQSHKSPNYFKHFYIRRTLRIFPLYYGTLVVAGVAALVLGVGPFADAAFGVELSHWLYIQNWLPLADLDPPVAFDHLWSLAIEEQFYLVWPALVWLALKYDRAQALCLLTAFFSLAMRVMLVALGEHAYFPTVSHLDGLALGALVAVLVQSGKLGRVQRALPWLAGVSAAIALTIGVARGTFYGHDPVVLLFGMFPLSVCFASMIALVVSAPEGGRLRRWLRSGPLGQIGTISYGLYVFHWPVIIVVRRRWPDFGDSFWIDQVSFALVAAVCTLAVALVSFKLFEQPILALKSRWT